MSVKEKRPNLSDISSAKEFRRWYWLKEELVAYCKSTSISTAGGKFEIVDRIAEYLETGKVIKPKRITPKTKRSRFDWAKAPLSLETVITDNLTFGKNFRGFMTEQIGSKFVCHSDFMDWVKANVGKTLADALKAWCELEDRKKDPNFKRKIAPQNMLAQYARDFLTDNPDLTHADMMRCWKLKKALPNEGKVVYEASDLLLQEQDIPSF